jgi:tetratricopeptide (TPR) repeat protein
MDLSPGHGGDLLARDEEVAALADVLDAGRESMGRSLFVIGDAGLGKTSLLRLAAERAGGFEVASGVGEPMETSLPLGLLDELLRSVEGGPRLAEVATAEPIDLMRTIHDWVSHRRGQPLLMLIDDLHWSDPDSLSVLAFLARRIERLPLTLIAALRPWPPEARLAVESLEQSAGVGTLRLEPLAPHDSERLLKRQLGDRSAGGREAEALRLCGGNPLLLEQAALAIEATADGSDPAFGEVPDELLVSRFAGLDENGMRLARAASALGSRFRIEDALAVAGLSREAGQEAATALRRSGLAEPAGERRLAFAHPLLAQVLYDRIDPVSLQAIHRAAFEVLRTSGREREAAAHAEPAGMDGDPEAIELLERVASAAAVAGAVGAAVEAREAAVRLAGDAASPSSRIALAEALVAAARVTEAVAVCRPVLADPDLDWRTRARTRLSLGHAMYLAGDPGRGDAEVDEATAIYAERDPVLAVRALQDRAVTAWMSAGPRPALDAIERARRVVPPDEVELGEEVDATRAHLSQELGDPGAWKGALPYGRRIAQGRISRLDPSKLNWPGSAVYAFAHCAQYGERYDDSLGVMIEAREALEEMGAAGGVATVSAFIGNHLNRRGRPAEGLAEADRADEFAELTPLIHPFARLVRAEALAWLGRLEDAERICLEVASFEPQGWLAGLWSTHVLGSIQLWRGDGQASDMLLEAEARADAVGLRELSDQPWEGHAIAAHLAAGREQDAVRVIERVEGAGYGPDLHWPGAIAALGRGQLLEYRGETGPAIAHLRKAVDRIDRVALPLRQAEARIALGGALRRSGLLVDAREPLAAAALLAETAGAERLAADAVGELQLAGGRRRRMPQDRDLLTQAEARVAREAAAGLTNAEISRRLHVS